MRRHCYSHSNKILLVKVSFLQIGYSSLKFIYSRKYLFGFANFRYLLLKRSAHSALFFVRCATIPPPLCALHIYAARLHLYTLNCLDRHYALCYIHVFVIIVYCTRQSTVNAVLYNTLSLFDYYSNEFCRFLL